VTGDDNAGSSTKSPTDEYFELFDVQKKAQQTVTMTGDLAPPCLGVFIVRTHDHFDHKAYSNRFMEQY
jgi:hypothetical protein